MKKTDIIIPVWNELDSTRKCVNALLKNTNYPHRLIIVDNGSDVSTKEYLESLKKDLKEYTLIRKNNNEGFIRAVNEGFKHASSPYVCILNNDAYVSKKWLTNIIQTIEGGPNNIGMANPSSNIFGYKESDGNLHEFEGLDSCRGFAMVIKKELIEKIGFFDEIYGMGYFEEKDFSRKAKDLGYISIRVKSSFVHHEDKLSFNKISNREAIFKNNEAIYNKRWGKPINIAFIVKGGTDLESWRKLAIYKLLDKGNIVHIFFSKGKPEISLKEHINVRYHRILKPFFRYVTFLKIMERLKKKKINAIIARGKTFNFFKKLQRFHKADVFIDDEKILNFL